MIRAIIEFLVMIGIAMLARAILRSVLGGIARASTQAFNAQAPNAHAGRSQPSSAPPPFTGGDLHKDPVCGTYVPESSLFKRRIGNETFYYCSETCREKHALAAR